MTQRNDFTPKYRGIYDKAMTGRSVKAAITCQCLACTACKTKDIRDCQTTDCWWHKYRPYQKIPYRLLKRPTAQNLTRTHTGQIAKTLQKSGQPIQRDLHIKETLTGPCRVRIIIEPEKV